VKDSRASGSYDQWSSRVRKKAEKLSVGVGKTSTKGPMRYSEIKATAKSVSSWTWTSYTGRSVNRGVMDIGQADIPLVNKQRLSARRTHEVRKEKTQEKILAATRLLHAAKQTINRSSVAKAAGVSRQTVSRYFSAVEAQIALCEEPSKANASIASVDEQLLKALADGLKVISLGTLEKTTGIGRRKLKKSYPSLFDP